MKAYGLPRRAYCKYLDSYDIHEYARPIRAGILIDVGRGGIRSSVSKRQTRRRFKRLARIEGKEQCRVDNT